VRLGSKLLFINKILRLKGINIADNMAVSFTVTWLIYHTASTSRTIYIHFQQLPVKLNQSDKLIGFSILTQDSSHYILQLHILCHLLESSSQYLILVQNGNTGYVMRVISFSTSKGSLI
jgi:hypothetical protein